MMLNLDRLDELSNNGLVLALGILWTEHERREATHAHQTALMEHESTLQALRVRLRPRVDYETALQRWNRSEDA